MLQNLIELVKNNSSLLKDPAITPARESEAATLAGTSIYDGIKSVLQGGGVSTVMNFFKGGQSDILSSEVGSEISGNFADSFSQKFGIGKQQAMSLAGSFLPGVLSQLVSKANDPADKSIDIQSMFNEMSGGKTSNMNISSIFTKIKSGLDQDKDGDVDFQDLKAAFVGKDGIIDKIKGVFK